MYGADYLESEDAAIFGSIGRAVGGVAKGAVKVVGGVARGGVKTVSRGVRTASRAARTVSRGVTSVTKVITNNPAWDIVQTGASLIPGVGQAVSAGMATVAAAGRGESLANIGLAAARGAIPGGPAVQAAFDVAVGLARGERLDRAALATVRKQLPGGELGQQAFDIGMAVARGGRVDDAAMRALSSRLPPRGKAILGQVQKAVQASQVATGQRLPNVPSLTATGNRVLRSLHMNPQLRKVPIRQLSTHLRVTPQTTRKAVVSFVNRFAPFGRNVSEYDVGSLETVEQVAARAGASLPSGQPAMAPVPVPRLRVPRALLVAIQGRGTPAIRAAIDRHGLLSRDTGALDAGGKVYVVEKGDYLSKIAKKLVGDANRWRELHKANPQIQNPDLIYPGQRLTLPASWVKAAPAPAPVPAPSPAPVPAPAPVTPVATAPTPTAPTPKVPVPSTIPTPPGVTMPSVAANYVFGVVQVMLAFFYQNHPDVAPSVRFGTAATDFAGVWDDRSTSAMRAFQLWANDRGKALPTDGMPDDASVDALRAQNEADIAGGVTKPGANTIPGVPGPIAQPVPTAPAPSIPGVPVPPPVIVLPGVPVPPVAPPVVAPVPAATPAGPAQAQATAAAKSDGDGALGALAAATLAAKVLGVI